MWRKRHCSRWLRREELQTRRFSIRGHTRVRGHRKSRAISKWANIIETRPNTLSKTKWWMIPKTWEIKTCQSSLMTFKISVIAWMVSIAILATCSQLSILRIRTNQFKRWLRVDHKCSASVDRGSIFRGKKCLRSSMIRMIKFLIWLRLHRLQDRLQTSAHPLRNQTLVRLWAICLFQKT